MQLDFPFYSTRCWNIIINLSTTSTANPNVPAIHLKCKLKSAYKHSYKNNGQCPLYRILKPFTVLQKFVQFFQRDEKTHIWKRKNRITERFQLYMSIKKRNLCKFPLTWFMLCDRMYINKKHHTQAVQFLPERYSPSSARCPNIWLT